MAKLLPIADAPRDGTPVLLWPHSMVGWWEFGDNEWMVMSIPLNEDLTIAHDWTKPKRFFCVYARMFGEEPTHYLPMPEIEDPD